MQKLVTNIDSPHPMYPIPYFVYVYTKSFLSVKRANWERVRRNVGRSKIAVIAIE